MARNRADLQIISRSVRRYVTLRLIFVILGIVFCEIAIYCLLSTTNKNGDYIGFQRNQQSWNMTIFPPARMIPFSQKDGVEPNY